MAAARAGGAPAAAPALGGASSWPASLTPALGAAVLAGFAAGFQMARVVDTLRAARARAAEAPPAAAASKARRKSRKRKKRASTTASEAQLQQQQGQATPGKKPRRGSDEDDEGDHDEGDGDDDDEEEEEDGPVISRERRLQENDFVLLEQDDSDDDDDAADAGADQGPYSASSRLEPEAGTTYCALVHGAINLAGLVERVASPFAGAIVTFSGTTRNSFEDKIVTQLEYTAYESMATKELYKVCAQVRERWQDVLHIAIEHKLGDSPVQDTSVVIAVSSAHRAAALEACHFAIDTLKARVPIWKKEKYLGRRNEAQWKENAEFLASRPTP